MSSLPAFLRKRRPKQSNPQAQSLFFSMLPPELRLQIFGLVLDCSPILLMVLGPPYKKRLVIWGGIVDETPPAVIFASRLLSILLSCSRAHDESLPLLYSLNTFYVTGPRTIRMLASGVGAPFLRRLEVHFSPQIQPPLRPSRKSPTWDSWLGTKHRREKNWAKYWEPITKFESLQYLFIEFQPMNRSSGDWWRGGELLIIKPLKDVLKEGVSGKLRVYWKRPIGLETAAEEILDRWTVERVVN